MSMTLTRTICLTLAMLPTQSLSQLATQAVSQEQSNPQVTQEVQPARLNCSQPASEQNAIIREAETDKYTTRRVEFNGNRYTGDMVLRRRIIVGLQEGDLFTRRNFIKSLRNVSKLKIIYPVRPRDVVMHLNRSEKTVDMNICFKERRRSHERE